MSSGPGTEPESTPALDDLRLPLVAFGLGTSERAVCLLPSGDEWSLAMNTHAKDAFALAQGVDKSVNDNRRGILADGLRIKLLALPEVLTNNRDPFRAVDYTLRSFVRRFLREQSLHNLPERLL